MTQQAQNSKWGDTRFVHIQDANLKRRVTAAFRYDDQNNQVLFAVAQCSKKDTFCKRIGRTVSNGRLMSGNSNQIFYTDLGDDRGFKAVTTAVVQRVLETLAEV